MAESLKGKKIAIIATDGVEQVELVKPREAVEQEGADTELLSLDTGEIQAMNHDLEPADKFPVDMPVAQASADDYDGLILPGGSLNADKLRVDGDVISFVDRLLQVRQAGRGDLSRTVDARRGRPRTRTDADLVCQSSHRHPQRGRRVGGQGGRRRSGTRVIARPGGPAGVLREDRRRVRRGHARRRERRGDGQLVTQPRSRRRRCDASISASASSRECQPPTSTNLRGSSSL